MATNLLNSAAPAVDATAGKPQGLPDKYWNPQRGEVDLPSLIADYNNMAMRDENLIEGNLRGIPESFDKYQLTIPHPLLERDDEVLQRLHAKHFTNEQAQLVYDLANERVIPLLDELTVNFEAQKQIERLKQHFGSQEKFNEISRQISTWAKQNLQPEIYDALSTTYEGVITLYKMMSSNEPILGREGGLGEELTESSLRKMMEDPRYWRDKDQSYVAKITKGFEKLYPSK